MLMLQKLTKSNYKNTKTINKKRKRKILLKKYIFSVLVFLFRDHFKSLVMILNKAQLLENRTPFQ